MSVSLSSKNSPKNIPTKHHLWLYYASIGLALFLIIGSWGVFTVVRAQSIFTGLKQGSQKVIETSKEFSGSSATSGTEIKASFQPLKNVLQEVNNKEATESASNKKDLVNDTNQKEEVTSVNSDPRVTTWIQTVFSEQNTSIDKSSEELEKISLEEPIE